MGRLFLLLKNIKSNSLILLEASTGIEPVYTDLQSNEASACADFQLALAVVLANKIRIPAIRRSKAGQRLGQKHG